MSVLKSDMDSLPKTSFGALGSTRASWVARYLIGKAFSVFLTALVVVLAVFVLIRLTGNPIALSLGDRLSEEELQRRISEAGYDKPVMQQLWNYLAGIIQGDFGVSTQSGLKVSEVIGAHFPATLELGFLGLVMAVVIAVPLGVLASKKPGGLLDSVLRSGAVAIYALPLFLISLALRIVFSIWIPVLPTSGRIGIEHAVQIRKLTYSSGFYVYDSLVLWDFAMLGSVLTHLLLPALSIAVLVAAGLLRVLRTNLVWAMKSEPIDFAKTLGVPEHRLLWPHSARLIAPQVLTSFGYSISAVIGGFVYAEVSFEFRGLGTLLAEAVLQRDFEVLQGTVIVLALLIVTVNASIDLIIQMLDRRQRPQWGSDGNA
jgi:peptide/nickel transport system permease protein